MAERDTYGHSELQRARSWTKSPIRDATEWGSVLWAWLRRRRAKKAAAEAHGATEAASSAEDRLWLEILEREPALVGLSALELTLKLRAGGFPDALIEEHIRRRFGPTDPVIER